MGKIIFSKKINIFAKTYFGINPKVDLPGFQNLAGLCGLHHSSSCKTASFLPFVSGSVQTQAPVSRAKIAASEIPPARP
jgi:hypothetical protein